MLVMKFGGTSVGSPEAIRQATALISRSCDQGNVPVVVVSAVSGITTMLHHGANAAVSGNSAEVASAVRRIRQTHYRIISEILTGGDGSQSLVAAVDKLINQYEALCKAVLVLGELTPRALDTMISIGERLSARILAGYLVQSGTDARAIDATRLIVTDNHFQNAAPLMDLTRDKCEQELSPMLEGRIVPVVTGYIGATVDGVTTTLGRGGSDYSAAIVAQALRADALWIWTDVNGVMTADPRLVPQARTIGQLSYREIAELAYYGAKVLHPKTIRPVIENNIPLRIKSTFDPDGYDTLVVADAIENNGKIKAVTAIRDLALVNVEGRGMLGVPGIAARTFGAVAQEKVSVHLITQASSEQSICFSVLAEEAERVIAGLEREFKAELVACDIDRIWAQRPVAIVTAVGAGMRGTPGIAGKMFSALGSQGVNIIAIAQGSSECSVSIVVDGKDTADAELAIHDLISAPLDEG